MKTFTGTVLRTSMDNTVVVLVERQWIHPVYKKTVRSSKKYLVHNTTITLHPGDTVSFTECPPISKRKRHKIVEKIEQ